MLIPPIVVQRSHGVGKSKLARVKMELVTKGRKIQILPKKVMILSGVMSGEWGSQPRYEREERFQDFRQITQ